MNKDYDKDFEPIFWYNMLYVIGSNALNRNDTDDKIDTLEVLFCGYWILTTLSKINE